MPCEPLRRSMTFYFEEILECRVSNNELTEGASKNKLPFSRVEMTDGKWQMAKEGVVALCPFAYLPHLPIWSKWIA